MGRGIKRIPSSNQEPEPSASQHRLLLDRIQAKVAEVNGLEQYDPVVAMALIATDPTIQANAITVLPNGTQVPTGNVPLALKAHSEVAKYTHPTLKQIEV